MKSVLHILPIVALAACTIEQTPARYIDHLETPQEELRASEAELTDRLRSLAASLERGNLRDIGAALAPHAEVYVYGPQEEALTSGPAVGRALSEAASGGAVTVRDLAVHVGARNSIAWFHVLYGREAAQEEGPDVRFTGVFVRQEGDWRLVHGHISSPATAAPVPAKASTPGGAG